MVTYRHFILIFWGGKGGKSWRIDSAFVFFLFFLFFFFFRKTPAVPCPGDNTQIPHRSSIAARETVAICGCRGATHDGRRDENPLASCRHLLFPLFVWSQPVFGAAGKTPTGALQGRRSPTQVLNGAHVLLPFCFQVHRQGFFGGHGRRGRHTWQVRAGTRMELQEMAGRRGCERAHRRVWVPITVQ